MLRAFTTLFIFLSVFSVFLFTTDVAFSEDDGEETIEVTRSELQKMIDEAVEKKVEEALGPVNDKITDIETELKNDDADDVADAIDDAIEAGVDLIPGSEYAKVPEKIGKAKEAADEYYEKYGEHAPAVTELVGGSSGSCGPVYYQFYTGEGNQPGQYEVDGYGNKTYH